MNLVMPMAGRGSRFERNGFTLPKPLISLHGKPFFEWAVQSLTATVQVEQLVFVVLREHVERHAIDHEISSRYPTATIVVIEDVTSGAAETAAIGIEALDGETPFAVNDCDHAFDAKGIDDTVAALQTRLADAALMCFRADAPGFSYVRLDAEGTVLGTVEKQVVSPFAIAGCYLFGSPEVFKAGYAQYRSECTYAELFMSGVYNTLLASGRRVLFHELSQHVPFGTPDELSRVAADAFAGLFERGK